MRKKAVLKKLWQDFGYKKMKDNKRVKILLKFIKATKIQRWKSERRVDDRSMYQGRCFS